MDIIVWNTGRQYTEHGQRIAAAQVGDTIYFVDVDRNVEGCYTVKSPEVALSTEDLQREVMRYYDGNNDEPIPTWTKEGKRIRDALVEAALREGQAKAQEAGGTKSFEVWYVKPGFTRDFLMGYEWLLRHMPELIPTTFDKLRQTHVRLATIRASDAGEVFMRLQGECWSPNGEARKLIRSLKLNHTSMSVGDIVVVDGRIVICDVINTVPKHSPWGQVQDAVALADGIVQVSTASHGGIWLSRERQKELRYKENFLRSAEWWEEDCDWAVPYAFFARDIRERGAAYRLEDNLRIAVAMIRRLHPAFLPRLKGRLNLEGTEA